MRRGLRTLSERLSIGAVFLNLMASHALRVGGFGGLLLRPAGCAALTSALKAKPPGASPAADSRVSWAAISRSTSNMTRPIRRRNTAPALRMASELSKTAISTMRVKDLREELQGRGLDITGIRPVLQARLGEAAAVERSRAPKGRTQTRDSIRSSGANSGIHTAREADRVLASPPSVPAQPLKGRESFPRNAPRQRMMSTSPRRTPDAASSRSTRHVMQFDGGSRGNPGPSGAGAVLYREGAGGEREEVWSGSVWVGHASTNNEAEYSGLIEGLRAAEKLGIKRLRVEGDSNLIIQQMLGSYKVSSAKMRPLFQEAKSIAKYFDELNLEHIRRAFNGRADQLANIAMDTQNSSESTHTDYAEGGGSAVAVGAKKWIQS